MFVRNGKAVGSILRNDLPAEPKPKVHKAVEPKAAKPEPVKEPVKAAPAKVETKETKGVKDADNHEAPGLPGSLADKS